MPLQAYGWLILGVVVVIAITWPRVAASAKDYANRKAMEEGRDPVKTAHIREQRKAAMEARLEAVAAASRQGDEKRRLQAMQAAKKKATDTAGVEELAGRRLEPRPLPEPDGNPLDPGFGAGQFGDSRATRPRPTGPRFRRGAG